MTFIPFVFLFAAAIKLQGEPGRPVGLRVPGGRLTITVLALVGMVTTLVSMALTLLPPPGESDKLLGVGKVVGLTLALLLAGAVVYARGRGRTAAAGAPAGRP